MTSPLDRRDRAPTITARGLGRSWEREPATTRLVRWRPDKRPDQCTYAQLDDVAPQELKAIFRTRSLVGPVTHPARLSQAIGGAASSQGRVG